MLNIQSVPQVYNLFVEHETKETFCFAEQWDQRSIFKRFFCFLLEEMLLRKSTFLYYILKMKQNGMWKLKMELFWQFSILAKNLLICPFLNKPFNCIFTLIFTEFGQYSGGGTGNWYVFNYFVVSLIEFNHVHCIFGVEKRKKWQPRSRPLARIWKSGRPIMCYGACKGYI